PDRIVLGVASPVWRHAVLGEDASRLSSREEGGELLSLRFVLRPRGHADAVARVLLDAVDGGVGVRGNEDAEVLAKPLLEDAGVEGAVDDHGDLAAVELVDRVRRGQDVLVRAAARAKVR